MKKYIFLTLLFLVLLPNMVRAYCSDSDTVRLQNIANNVTVSYIYNDSTGRFTITFSNLRKDLILVDFLNNKKYVVEGDLNFTNLDSGKHIYTIYSNSIECGTNELIKKYVNLPYYNHHFGSIECEGIEDYKYCSKWFSNPVSDDIWNIKVNDYKKSIEDNNKKEEKQKTTSLFIEGFNIIKKIYIKGYFVILPIIIIGLVIIIIKKRNEDSLV